MKWWKKWRDKVKTKKRHKWEERAYKYGRGLSKRTDDEIIQAIRDLDVRLTSIEGRIVTLENIITTKGSWKVIQGSDNKTEWVKQDAIKYVSKIYTTGPENAFYFDAIIDGEKVVFSADTEAKVQQAKLDLLDVERVEEFDELKQQEIFGEEVAKNGRMEYDK